jgi:hypothetical protein
MYLRSKMGAMPWVRRNPWRATQERAFLSGSHLMVFQAPQISESVAGIPSLAVDELERASSRRTRHWARLP